MKKLVRGILIGIAFIAFSPIILLCSPIFLLVVTLHWAFSENEKSFLSCLRDEWNRPSHDCY